jgi:hypothetical protein
MRNIYVFIASFLIFLIAGSTIYAAPASLSFDPLTIQVKQGDIVKFNINMYSGDDAVASTDISISYDKGLLEPLPSEIIKGNIFETVQAKIISPGNLYVYGIQEDKTAAKTAQGTVATISFKALHEGTSTLSFNCNPIAQNSSQIIKANDLGNIISCAATSAHTSQITITKGNVLGAYTQSYGRVGSITVILGILVAVFTFFIFLKYQRLRKDITT